MKTDADGFVAGRDINGKPMRAKILGESKARRLNRELEEAAKIEADRIQAEKRSGSRRSRRRRRKK